MMKTTRRNFVAMAAALGATAAWAQSTPVASLSRWTERRDLYPEGVASGDPDATSVILWTRRPFSDGRQSATLLLEVAKDQDFTHIVASVESPVSQASDWTTRALVGGLEPAHVYWYRFTDETGAGSRIGRTITAPALDDLRPVRFAFVSCQSVNEGAQNAYRRMIWEDRRAPPDQRLGFVLHLGDFIYEVVEYPDELARRYDRTVYDIGRIPEARHISDFHVPTSVDGYRMVYRAHIADPDIQDARAWFPFVCIGDNHEFSWMGWQSFIKYPGGATEPAQRLRVAANQAWWEYIPSRVRKASGPDLAALRRPVRRERAGHALRSRRSRRRAEQPHRARQHDRLPGDAIRPPRRAGADRPAQLHHGASDHARRDRCARAEGLSRTSFPKSRFASSTKAGPTTAVTRRTRS